MSNNFPNLINTGGPVADEEQTSYGAAAPTSTAGAKPGATYYVTPDGTASTADQATSVCRFDGTKWVCIATPEAAPVHASEVQLATAAQDEFTLDDTPIGAVIVTRNGVDISDSFTWVGAVGTYDPAENLDCVIDENDKIRFHYETAA